MRTLSVISGIGLLILWIVSLGTPGSAAWLTWLDGVAAVLAFIVAGVARTPREAVGEAGALSLGIFALWIIGMGTNGAPYQNWWSFVFACVMAIAAIYGYSQRGRTVLGQPTVGTTRPNEDRFRKSA